MKFLYLSDSVPRLSGGYGFSVQGFNWIQMFSEEVCGIVCPRGSTTETRSLGKPIWEYPEASIKGLNRILPKVRAQLDAILLRRDATELRRFMAETKAERIFVYAGSDWKQLWVLREILRYSELPVDLYLGDDYEESTRRRYGPRIATLTKRLEKEVLSRVDRIFAVSEGYCEHIRDKYGLQATWVPIAVPGSERLPRSGGAPPGGLRRITFLGSINYLYESAIRSFLDALQRWNDSGRGDKWHLKIVSRGDPGTKFGEFRQVWTHEVANSAGEMKAVMANSDACLIPYSFAEEERVLVSTSFPTKFTEPLQYQVPVIVWGPAYCSAVRYAKQVGLPYVASNVEELNSAFRDLEIADPSADASRMESVFERYHSAAALRHIILGEVRK